MQEHQNLLNIVVLSCGKVTCVKEEGDADENIPVLRYISVATPLFSVFSLGSEKQLLQQQKRHQNVPWTPGSSKSKTSHCHNVSIGINWFLCTQIAAKRNPQQDKEAQEWIETVTGEKFPAGQLYEDVIRDGQVLCKLINKLAPGSVPKINSSGGQFKMMENINK